MAIAGRQRFRIHDALVIAADACCGTLYAEDLTRGQTIEGVRIVEPFG